MSAGFSAYLLRLKEAAAPATPDTGEVVLYAKSDGLFYSKDDAGTETLVSGGAGGGGVTDADYLVKTAHAGLSAERAVTDTASITWDWATAGQAKANVGGAATLYGALDALTLQGADIASATTTNLATATGIHVNITGTATITGHGTAAAGVVRILKFAGILTYTHNATSLILPTGANITTAANDTAILVSLGSGNWRCVSYQRADGTSLAGGGGSGTIPYASPSGFRLTTESGVSVSTSDRTSQGTLYMAVHTADFLLIPNTGATDFDASSPGALSLALTLTSGKNYDVFCWNNGGTPTIALSSAWTDDTTRADALGTLKGIVVNNATIGSMGAKRGIFLGTIRASGTNIIEDSKAKRFVWNAWNRVERGLISAETDNSWTYSTNAFRQANGDAANQVEVVNGLLIDTINIYVSTVANNSVHQLYYVAVGTNSTTAFDDDCVNSFGSDTDYAPVTSRLITNPRVGYTYYAWLESGDGTATTTFVGDLGKPTQVRAGITAQWRC